MTDPEHGRAATQDQLPDERLNEQRRQMAQGPPGGSASRGPEFVPPTGDTEAQGLVPPYERPEPRATGQDGAEGVRRAFRPDEYAGEPGEAPPVSAEERKAPSPTDTTAATPLGVGESSRSRGEEAGGKEAGRQDTGRRGPSGRPTGTSTGSDVTGINPSSGGTQQNEGASDRGRDS
ncbi:MAG: hypothetical protein ACT4O0_16405 [Pseudonocardia sp.]|jgi:hypothetical protein